LPARGIEDRSDVLRATGEQNREGRAASELSEDNSTCSQFPLTAFLRKFILRKENF